MENEQHPETRPSIYEFTSDTPEFYRWYEYGGKPREKPLSLEELEKFLVENRGYPISTVREVAWSAGARPEKTKAAVVDQEGNPKETALSRPEPAPVVSEKKKEPEKQASRPTTPEQGIEANNALPETYLKSSEIPEGVKKRYLQVGNRFYFEKNPDQLAFEDKGHKLNTKSNGVAVAAALVEIAHSRGWTEIKVKGAEEFRRAVWLKANVQGIECKGYDPKETDLATLEKLSMQKALWEKKPEELVREHPELSNEAVTLKLAEKVSQRFPNKTDQKRFMAGVVDRVSAQLEQGQPLPQVKIREPKRSREKLVQER
jgi:hypothetical protein